MKPTQLCEKTSLDLPDGLYDAVIRVYDDAGNVIEAHEQGRFQGVVSSKSRKPGRLTLKPY